MFPSTGMDDNLRWFLRICEGHRRPVEALTPHFAARIRSSSLRRRPRRPSQASRPSRAQRPDDHERVEDDHRFERQDLACPVERRVPARRGGRDDRRLGRLQSELDRGVACLAATWACAARACASSLRAASRRASSVARVSASRSDRRAWPRGGRSARAAPSRAWSARRSDPEGRRSEPAGQRSSREPRGARSRPARSPSAP